MPYGIIHLYIHVENQTQSLRLGDLGLAEKTGFLEQVQLDAGVVAGVGKSVVNMVSDTAALGWRYLKSGYEREKALSNPESTKKYFEDLHSNIDKKVELLSNPGRVVNYFINDYERKVNLSRHYASRGDYFTAGRVRGEQFGDYAILGASLYTGGAGTIRSLWRTTSKISRQGVLLYSLNSEIDTARLMSYSSGLGNRGAGAPIVRIFDENGGKSFGLRSADVKFSKNSKNSLLHQFNSKVEPKIQAPELVAIHRGWQDLSKRQAEILAQLPKRGSKITLKKSSINVTDLAALTAKTGDEFAMFTWGQGE